jgi:hypothetical protein
MLLAVAAFIAGCYSGPSADHYVGILDELNVPPDWEVAETIAMGPDQAETCDPFFSNSCPVAIRTFRVDEMQAAYSQAKAVLNAAGFAITLEATAGCSTGSSTGPTCAIFAVRGE